MSACQTFRKWSRGVNFVVVDKSTGQDITRSILLQVLAAREQGGAHLLTHEFLLQLIRVQARGKRSAVASYLEQSLAMFKNLKS